MVIESWMRTVKPATEGRTEHEDGRGSDRLEMGMADHDDHG